MLWNSLSIVCVLSWVCLLILAVKVEEDDGIQYDASWMLNANDYASGHLSRRTSMSGGTATYSFIGGSSAWFHFLNWSLCLGPRGHAISQGSQLISCLVFWIPSRCIRYHGLHLWRDPKRWRQLLLQHK